MTNDTLAIFDAMHCVDSELGFDRFFFFKIRSVLPHKKNSVLVFITAREHTVNGINVDPVAQVVFVRPSHCCCFPILYSLERSPGPQPTLREEEEKLVPPVLEVNYMYYLNFFSKVLIFLFRLLIYQFCHLLIYLCQYGLTCLFFTLGHNQNYFIQSNVEIVPALPP